MDIFYLCNKNLFFLGHLEFWFYAESEANDCDGDRFLSTHANIILGNFNEVVCLLQLYTNYAFLEV